MMMPEMNWAPNPALYNSWLRRWNCASTSFWRPNTFTRAWPVKASSMWALSSPVDFQFCAKSFCERLPITETTSMAMGTDTSATSARMGEIQNIMISTPITMSSELSS